jgi:putative phosphoribosyl transferase
MILAPPPARVLLNGAPHIECDDRYADRAAAGRRLAELLSRYRGGRALVLALPPGGVAVAGELARALRLPLDVLVARDLVVRPYPSVVVGALSEGGGLCLNRAALRLPGISLGAIWYEARRAANEIAALVELYRHGRRLPFLNRRVVILADDGLGSGLVQLAAIRALRRIHASRCIVATPSGASSAIGRTRRWADELVMLADEADGGQADAGHWQQPLGDEDAAALLDHYRHLRVRW